MRLLVMIMALALMQLAPLGVMAKEMHPVAQRGGGQKAPPPEEKSYNNPPLRVPLDKSAKEDETSQQSGDSGQQGETR